MKKIIVTFILLNLTFSISNAQAPQKLWDSFFNGNLNGKDAANSIVTDNAGNVFVTGKSYQSLSTGNFTTIMYDANGNQQWADHYAGNQTFAKNEGVKVVIDNWQNVYAIGTVALHAGDIAIAKYNTNGIIWSHNYEPYAFGSDVDFGVDIAVDSAGNIYACGQVTSMAGNLWDMYTVKCDSAGNKLLDENFTSASGDDYPTGVAVTPGGNFYALTNSYNFFGTATYDIFTINYLSNFNHNWESKYNGAGNAMDYGTFIKADNYNNTFVCGTADMGTNDDMVVMKQNQYGTRLWVTTYNGTANANDTAISTKWLPNGFVAVTGKCKEIINSIARDAFVTMVIDSGIIVWTKKFYGSDSLGAIPTQMVTDLQGNIYICGYENLIGGTKNGCIIKYDTNGNLLWNISYDAGASLDDKFNAIALDYNNDILVTGQTYTSATNANYVTVKYGNNITGVNENLFPTTYDILAYPNPVKPGGILNVQPVNPSSKIQFTLFDLSGREIEKGNLNSGLLTINNKIFPGTYILRVNTNEWNAYKKVLVAE
ncbi:MAG: T9SS type A sorting domain-containing protein [Bacteroidia bacterium]